MTRDDINKLIYESGLIAQGCWDKFDEYDRQALEKFAELIVRECIRLCDQVDYVGADECIDNIREHFEVER